MLHLDLASFPSEFVSFAAFSFQTLISTTYMGINVLIQGAYATESFSANLPGDSCTNKTSKVTNGELYMFKKFENKTVNIHLVICQRELNIT